MGISHWYDGRHTFSLRRGAEDKFTVENKKAQNAMAFSFFIENEKGRVLSKNEGGKRIS